MFKFYTLPSETENYIFNFCLIFDVFFLTIGDQNIQDSLKQSSGLEFIDIFKCAGYIGILSTSTACVCVCKRKSVYMCTIKIFYTLNRMPLARALRTGIDFRSAKCVYKLNTHTHTC